MSLTPIVNPFSGNLQLINSGSGGTPAGSNTQIQYNNSGSFGASPNLTFVAGTTLQIGAASSSTGILNLANSSSPFITAVNSIASQNWTLTLPGAPAAVAGYVLEASNTSGATNWADPKSLVTAAGNTGDVQINVSGLFNTGSSDSIFFDKPNELFGVQTLGLPIAAGHFKSALAQTIGSTSSTTGTTQLESLISAPTGDSVTIVAPLTIGSYNGASNPNYGSGSYIANGSTYNWIVYNYYNDGTTIWYSPVATTTNFTDDNSGNPFTADISWSATTTGGNYTGTIVGRNINGGGFQYVDIGAVGGGTGSIADDGSGSPYNWGSSSFPSGFSASSDYTGGGGLTYTYLVFSIGTSPSGHTYYVQGDTPTINDAGVPSGFPYRLSLNNPNGNQVKFEQTAGGSLFKIINASSSYIQFPASPSDSSTVTPNSYGYGPDGTGTTPNYYRTIAYGTVSGHTVYSVGAWSSPNFDDATNNWYSSVSRGGATGASGYYIEHSPDGITPDKNFNLGTATTLYDDALTSWSGGAAPQTPTSFTPPAGLFQIDTSVGSPNLVIQDIGTSAQPEIQFQDSFGNNLGIISVSSGNLYMRNDTGIFFQSNNLILEVSQSQGFGYFTGGNFGVGTSIPGFQLDVNGFGRFHVGNNYLKISGGGGRSIVSAVSSSNVFTELDLDGSSILMGANSDAPTAFAAMVALPIRNRVSAYTITNLDHTINCLSGAYNITLPDATTITSFAGFGGAVFVIKNSDTGVITVDTTGGQTIDDQLTYTLNQYEKITVQSHPLTGKWIIIGT